MNGSRVDIPSYQVRQGEVVAVREGSRTNPQIQLAVENARAGSVAGWLSVDFDKLSGTFVRPPMREDIDIEIQEQLIVELYSK